jgi:flagellar protein FlaI
MRWLQNDRMAENLREYARTMGMPFLNRGRGGDPDPGDIPGARSNDLPLPVPDGAGDDAPGDAYWLVPGFSYAKIARCGPDGFRYDVIEPELEQEELLLLSEIYEYIRDVVLYDSPRKKGEMVLSDEDLQAIIRKFAPAIPAGRVDVLSYYLRRNFLGLGRIDPLMNDDRLEDISCNGAGLPVYVYHRDYASVPTNLLFGSDELNRFVLKLAQKADKQISLTTPLVDASLPDGSRIQLTFSDVVSTRGSSFTVRKFRRDPMTPRSLMEFGTYSPELLAFIWLAIENRRSMIVVGGTASGKTSTMNAISFFIPHNAKIVSIEDTREIQLSHRNWLPTQTREINVRGSKGDIDMFALLRAALRQRPEYIIVGEVRGREAQTLFQAMNTGHTTFSTLHAGSIDEAVNRLINEPISVPPAMLGALDLIVIQSLHYRNGQTIRRCDALHEVRVESGRDVRHDVLYRWDPVTDRFFREYGRSRVLESIAAMHGWSDEELERQLFIRRDALCRLASGGDAGVGEMVRVISGIGGGGNADAVL